MKPTTLAIVLAILIAAAAAARLAANTHAAAQPVPVQNR